MLDDLLEFGDHSTAARVARFVFLLLIFTSTLPGLLDGSTDYRVTATPTMDAESDTSMESLPAHDQKVLTRAVDSMVYGITADYPLSISDDTVVEEKVNRLSSVSYRVDIEPVDEGVMEHEFNLVLFALSLLGLLYSFITTFR